MTLKDQKTKQYIRSSTMKKDNFIINGCGTFGEARKSLNKAEAGYLYIELHKWLFAEEENKTE